MNDGYQFDRTFRERIIALCLRADWFSRYGTELVRPEYFELKIEQDVVEAILQFYVQYRRTPARDELATKVPDANDLLIRVYGYDSDELTYAADVAVQFAQEQAMKLAILESVDDLEAGDYASPLDRVRQALKVGMDLDDIGIILKENGDWIYDEILADKVQTGILHLDLMLDGGLSSGEVGVVLAGTNVGKTQTLVNFGCGAATWLSKCIVVHATLELSAQKVAKRYAARTTFRWLDKSDDPEQYVQAFRDAAGFLMPGEVYIREWPTASATVEDIEAYLERLRLLGINAELLIVDYVGEMKHKRIGEYRHNLGHTVAELRSLAGRWQIPVWTAIQTTRGSLSKPLVTLSDIAESFEQARKADVVLAMCQTNVEQEEGIVRFYAAKVRDGKAGWMVRCHLDDEAHAVISDEIITVSQLMKELKRQKEENG